MPHYTDQDGKKSVEPLAIVGLALRYPGDVTSSDDFWKMMMERRCAATKFPSDRLNVDAHHNPDASRQDSLSINGGHFLSGGLGAFDASFFSIPAAEAEGMDPQQRFMLETTYHALENAGISLEKAAGSQTCVFTGCSSNDYATFFSKDPQNAGKYAAYGQSMTMVANRISWFYNLKGPSVNVDTACSSGLVALDSACHSIWSGASTTGLVVGANLIFAREFAMALDNLGVLSQDNRCFTFDERANGYGRGEGVGAIVIKPVKDAIRDGDTIRAVIRSTRSNQDGWTPGITQPNRESQQILIENTYRQAELDPATTRYFEAHGTGTPTGDPIEMRAIGAVFRPYRSPEDPLYVGSVKSNIGHLEGGSGIAGLIKVVLSLEKGVIPPVSENFRSTNPGIDLDYLNLKIVSKPVVWPAGLRRASINSFGFGGTNSHVILDDALHFIEREGLTANHTSCAHPSLKQCSIKESDTNGSHANGSHANGEKATHRSVQGIVGTSSHPHILTWSASDESGIQRLAQVWKPYFRGVSLNPDESEQYLHNLAHTLNRRRSRLPWMTYALMDANTKLEAVVDSWKPPTRCQESRNMAYVFSGQGAQWPAMGCELLARYPAYRHSLIEAGNYLQGLGCEWDLLEELHKGDEKSLVNDPTLAQPLCTAIQIALVDLLSLFGLKPATVVGHSSGEIAAAYCARSISREYAWRLAYFRGLWAANLATSSTMDGAMMAVALSPEQVQAFLDTLHSQEEQLRVVVACVNSRKSVTLSGQRSQINILLALFQEKEIMARVLPIPVAYHSFQMEEIAIAYRDSIGDDTWRPSDRPQSHSPQMISSVNGEWVDGDTLSKAEYWVNNLLSTVQFLDAFRKLSTKHAVPLTKKLDGSHRKRLTIDTVVEIGPHAAMRGPCRDILRESGRNTQVEYLSVLTRKSCGVRTALEAMAHLRCMGYPVDLNIVNSKPSKINKQQPKVLTDLPSYQFNKTKSYWREGIISKSFRFRRFGRHELLGLPDDDWNPLLPKWNNILQPSDPVWVKDHQVNNTIIVPGAGMLSMAIEATKQLISPEQEITGFSFKNVNFMSALVIPADTAGLETRFCMRPQREDGPNGDGWYEFSLYSCNSSWIKNCTGSIQAVIGKPSMSEIDGNDAASMEKTEALDQLRQMTERSTTVLDSDHFYSSLTSSGLQFGPTFTVIRNVASDQGHHQVTDVQTYTSDALNRWNGAYTIHPTTLDGLMQGTQVLRSQAGQKRIAPSIPIYLDRAWVSNVGLSHPAAASIKVGTKLCHEGQRESTFSLIAASQAADQVLITIDGVTFRAIDSQSSVEEYGTSSESSKCHQIDWKPDFDLMNEDEIMQFCNDYIPDSAGHGVHYLNMELMIAGFIFRAGNAISRRKKVKAALAQPYMDWLKHNLQVTRDGKSPFSSKYWQERIQDDVGFAKLCASVEEASQLGKTLVNVGIALVEYAEGKHEQPLSRIVDVELLENSYEELVSGYPSLQSQD